MSQHSPVAVDDSYSTPKSSRLTIVAPGVLKNDTDADGDAKIAVMVKTVTAAQGTLILLPNGSFTFTPARDFSGAATFTYRTTDATGLTSSTAMVKIDVERVDNDNWKKRRDDNWWRRDKDDNWWRCDNDGHWWRTDNAGRRWKKDRDDDDWKSDRDDDGRYRPRRQRSTSITRGPRATCTNPGFNSAERDVSRGVETPRYIISEKTL